MSEALHAIVNRTPVGSTSGDPFTPHTPEARLLVESAQIINGERQDQYGSAESSFGTIASYWEAHLRATNPGMKVCVTGKDVASMMVSLKLAREAHSPKYDNRVDAAGYVALMERITLDGH